MMMKRFLSMFLTIILFSGLSAYATAESDAVLIVDEMLAKGQQYESSDGVEQECTKAMAYCLSAAEAGNGEGMRRVGRLYQYGNGVEINCEKAMEWYLKAAEAGNDDSMFNAGVYYYLVQGVEQDAEKASEGTNRLI